MKNKFIKYLFILFSLVIIYIFTGKTNTIYKNVPTIHTPTQSYSSSIIFPSTSTELQEAGQGVGLALDNQGYIYYLHRGSNTYGETERLITEAPIIKVDPTTKKVIAKIGQNIFMSPHGIDVDSENNIWVTDISLNKIIVLDSKGNLKSMYGEDYPFYLETFYRIKNIFPNLPLFVSKHTFARPTDIIVNADGSFVVTDGYRNKRLAKFCANGDMLWEVNKAGSDDGEFNLPHGLTADSNGNLYVADRKNSRIQVFTENGEWLTSWENPELGRPYGIEYGLDGFIYLVDGGDMLDGKIDNPRSHILKLDINGNIVWKISKYGNNIGEINTPHDIVTDLNGNIYIAELNNNRLQMFTLQ